jgi:hypothetical protein
MCGSVIKGALVERLDVRDISVREADESGDDSGYTICEAAKTATSRTAKRMPNSFLESLPKEIPPMRGRGRNFESVSEKIVLG